MRPTGCLADSVSPMQSGGLFEEEENQKMHEAIQELDIDVDGWRIGDRLPNGLHATHTIRYPGERIDMDQCR